MMTINNNQRNRTRCQRITLIVAALMFFGLLSGGATALAANPPPEKTLNIPSPEDQVSTDKQDYAPGETAKIAAVEFQVGETVQFLVLHNDSTPNTGGGHEPWQVTDGSANDLDGMADGNIVTAWYVNPDDSAESAFELTATGLSSGQGGKWGRATVNA